MEEKHTYRQCLAARSFRLGLLISVVVVLLIAVAVVTTASVLLGEWKKKTLGQIYTICYAPPSVCFSLSFGFLSLSLSLVGNATSSKSSSSSRLLTLEDVFDSKFSTLYYSAEWTNGNHTQFSKQICFSILVSQLCTCS